jgi:hypothetical protein
MSRFLLGLALLCSLAAFGQSVTSVTGTVVDPTGAVIPDAEITLENTDNSQRRVSQSDATGKYSFNLIAPGNYRILAKKSGFADVQINGLRFLVNTPAAVNITFEKVGAVAETISVDAEAVQVNTTDASIGNSFGTKPIVQLPFEARNVVGLLSLQPGVTFIGDPDRISDSRNGAVSGGKSDQANVTLDGVDVNDQQNRWAFASVLRVTLDSVQEFRVTTLNANADQGRTSGAQVALVTKSGTNEIHGSLYEYHRNTITTANSFFNNASNVERPQLIRNVFGASIGGPVVKNKLFYFLNYEGRRDASALGPQTPRSVPSMLMRQGILQYQRADGSIAQVSAADLGRLVDPTGQGVNQAALRVLQSYPEPNSTEVGDGLNIVGYRFNSPVKLRQNTYIAKFDYNLDSAGRHTFFGRGNLQNDNDNITNASLPQFPGEPPNNVNLTNSKGLAIGYTHVLSPQLVGNFRYGYTRQGTENSGVSNLEFVTFRNLSNRFGTSRAFVAIIPVHHISEDLSWTKGSHTVQFGGVARWIRNKRQNFANSFSSASINASWLDASGAGLNAPFTDMAATFRVGFRDAAAAVLGLVTQGNANYNYTIDGQVLPTGAPVRRNFAGEEYEFYIQDVWKATRNLTITAGLRYSLMPPIYELEGQQVSPDRPLESWFNQRGGLADAGRPQSEVGLISYVPSNSPQGRDLYPFHKKNWAPRLALAYSPTPTTGLGRFLFGGPNKTSIRAGWGMYYDLFGMGLMREFDSTAFGLSNSLQNPSAELTIATAPRFTGINNLPRNLLPPAPRAGFPATYPDAFAITNGLDDSIRPPYNMSMNLTLQREIGNGFVFQGSYVGRLSRRSLTRADIATPTNLTDPASGQSYFEAAQQLARLSNAGTATANVQRIPFWENIYPGLATSTLTATQVAYNRFNANNPDWSFALYQFDVTCAAANRCSKFGPYAFFNRQYSYLSVLRSIGGGNYHGMNLTLRKRFSNGDQFDVNYTWSKSIDLSSNAERAAFNAGNIINPWFPEQRKGVSDFDTTQQMNANWVLGIPVGRNARWGSNMGRALDAVVGGWQIAGLFRMTTGLPVSVGNGRFWPTNWNITGWATQTGIVPDPKTNKNAPAVTGAGGPNIFDDPRPAAAAYSNTLPGETGQRNGVRGDGFFGLDASLAKRFTMPYKESHSLQFRWEVFNVTNTVRFDPTSATIDLGNIGTFGKYTDTLTTPRVMQFALRYEF